MIQSCQHFDLVLVLGQVIDSLGRVAGTPFLDCNILSPPAPTLPSSFEDVCSTAVAQFDVNFLDFIGRDAKTFQVRAVHRRSYPRCIGVPIQCELGRSVLQVDAGDISKKWDVSSVTTIPGMFGMSNLLVCLSVCLLVCLIYVCSICVIALGTLTTVD